MLGLPSLLPNSLLGPGPSALIHGHNLILFQFSIWALNSEHFLGYSHLKAFFHFFVFVHDACVIPHVWTYLVRGQLVEVSSLFTMRVQGVELRLVGLEVPLPLNHLSSQRLYGYYQILVGRHLVVCLLSLSISLMHASTSELSASPCSCPHLRCSQSFCDTLSLTVSTRLVVRDWG